VVDALGNEVDCMWFVRCERPATGLTPHPALGDVPTCDRCAYFSEHGEFPKEVNDDND
jgi:hypothetical protein